MKQIELILPQNQTRGWHLRLISQIRDAGYKVSVQFAPVSATPFLLKNLLKIEQALLLRRTSQLLAYQAINIENQETKADLRVDLTGIAGPSDIPTLGIARQRGQSLLGPAIVLAKGDLPVVQLTLDDQIFDIAHPMIDNRFALTRGLEDVLARTTSLVLKGIERVQQNIPASQDLSIYPAASENSAGVGSLAYSYFTRMLPRLLSETFRRATSHTHSHWCVGYRLIDGPGVAETHDLTGPAWTRIPDDTNRFYADPFPFNWQGRHYIFVEDYEHAKGKGIISVTEVMPDGTATPPQLVLEEDYHLSYPNVFQSGGEIWMLPEAGASGEVVLYRATNFPFKWERHKTLITDRELADPTLLERDGLLWLFTAERDGAGSSADMMSVFFSKTLEGPWTPHPANPVLIDRARARPGGNFIISEERVFLPLQDGTETYGGALGIGEITRLTTAEIEIGKASPIQSDGDWSYPKIHTLNRAGRLEVIDGIAS